MKSKRLKNSNLRRSIFKKFFIRRIGVDQEVVALKLRDIALSIEEEKPDVSLKIFLIAQYFKKNGTLINKKITQLLKHTSA